jgi:hypothetical protein
MCPTIGQDTFVVSSPQNAHTPREALRMPSVYWHNLSKTVGHLHFKLILKTSVYFHKWTKIVYELVLEQCQLKYRLLGIRIIRGILRLVAVAADLGVEGVGVVLVGGGYFA